MKKNSYYTADEYKTMPETELIKTYENLITKLAYKYGGSNNFDDVKQDVTLALLKCQKDFDPKRGAYFSAYIRTHLLYAAQLCKHNCNNVVGVPYCAVIKSRKNNTQNPQHTVPIYDYIDDNGDHHNTCDHLVSVKDKEYIDNDNDNYNEMISIIKTACKKNMKPKMYDKVINFLDRNRLEKKQSSNMVIANAIRCALKGSVLDSSVVRRIIANG